MKWLKKLFGYSKVEKPLGDSQWSGDPSPYVFDDSAYYEEAVPVRSKPRKALKKLNKGLGKKAKKKQ